MSEKLPLERFTLATYDNNAIEYGPWKHNIIYTAKKEPDWVTSVAYGICPPAVTIDTLRTNRKYYGHCPSMYIM